MPAAVETMVSANNMVPWHGLGVIVPDASLPAEQAMRLAGLDWTVKKIPYKRLIDGVMKDSVSSFEIRRMTDDKELGSVGKNYDPIQPFECFDFVDSLVEAGTMGFHTAGALSGGKVVWALAKVKADPLEAVPGDLVEQYVLMTTSYDGRNATRIAFTPTRVVCWNTLVWALQGSKSTFSVRHTRNQRDKLQQAAEAFGIMTKQRDQFSEAVDVLVNKQVNGRALDALLKDLFPSKAEDEGEPAHAKTQEIRNTVKGLFTSGKGQDIPGVSGTAWAALNAVTEYTNHFRLTRPGSHRLQSTWLGSGERSGSRLNMAATKFLLTFDENDFKKQYVHAFQTGGGTPAKKQESIGSRFMDLDL